MKKPRRLVALRRHAGQPTRRPAPGKPAEIDRDELREKKKEERKRKKKGRK